MVSIKFVARSRITKANAADAVNRAADALIQSLEKLIAKKCLIKQGALLNAVVHKDYSSGNPLQISVYEDKIIFWNAGRLPDELSLELLQKKHPSIPYNPLVASAFFRAGYIEAWGRGIEKINNECKVAGAPAPEISYKCRVDDNFSGKERRTWGNITRNYPEN